MTFVLTWIFALSLSAGIWTGLFMMVTRLLK
jgi:hypothetical protein